PIAPGTWSAHIAVRGEETIDVTFTVNDAHEIVGLQVHPGATSKEDAGKLQRARKPAYTQPDYVRVPVTAMELRALTRSLAAVRLRETINELSVETRSTLDESNVRERRDLSPEQKYRLIQKYNREIASDDAVENAQKRAQVLQAAKKLKKLIAQYGGAWTPDERPANHPSMLY
ncbi:MAG TPA: hypothetical protein VL326_23815, partial [Kofleriaceae bacterium]|nr:hypothetical protein [Kofleriaceae bacterium]